jgi:hypothetical protein
VRIWGFRKEGRATEPLPRRMRGATVASTCFRRSRWVGAGWFGDRSEAPPPAMSSLPAERSEAEPSLGATESPRGGRPCPRIACPGIRPARRLKDAVIAGDAAMIAFEVVAVEGISDPPEQANLGRITQLPPLPLDQSGKVKRRIRLTALSSCSRVLTVA